MNDELAKQNDDLAKLNDWTRLSQGDRHNRIARAIKNQDTEQMQEMLAAFIRHDSEAGFKTSDHTITSYTKALQLLIEYQGDHALHKTDESDAKGFRAWLQSELADKSVDSYITGARRVYDGLQWCGFRTDTENPFRNISTTDKTDAGQKADPYSTEELNALLDVADARDQVIFLLAADGGLRLAEICALQWRDVDRTNKEIRIREGKGRKSRSVHATNRLLDALGAFREEEDPNDEDPIISVSRRRVQQILEQRCNRADVRCRGIHNLRHTCGTRLYEETRDLQVVAKHLGHSSTKTAEIYAHLADSDYREAVDALDSNGVK
jgi:integrase/recombinase XerC